MANCRVEMYHKVDRMPIVHPRRLADARASRPILLETKPQFERHRQDINQLEMLRCMAVAIDGVGFFLQNGEWVEGGEGGVGSQKG